LYPYPQELIPEVARNLNEIVQNQSCHWDLIEVIHSVDTQLCFSIYSGAENQILIALVVTNFRAV